MATAPPHSAGLAHRLLPPPFHGKPQHWKSPEILMQHKAGVLVVMVVHDVDRAQASEVTRHLDATQGCCAGSGGT